MSEALHHDYRDSYPTCVETYSTLRIFSDDLAPDQITEALAIEPTGAFGKGDLHSKGKLRRKTNGWFYSTKKLNESRDTRRHLDMILNALDGKERQIRELQARGCKTNITSYWVSSGQGGPWLMPDQMLRLGALNIDIWWDVYFSSEDET
jgi:Domain of unknown function (DUF4279)